MHCFFFLLIVKHQAYYFRSNYKIALKHGILTCQLKVDAVIIGGTQASQRIGKRKRDEERKKRKK